MATTSIEAANLFNVKGIVAVITGGGTGIGLMMARALALNGAHKVYIVGRRADIIEKAAQSVPGGTIVPLAGDVTSKASLQAVAANIAADAGYLNLVVANSGIGGPAAQKPDAALPLAEFQKQLWEASEEEYVDTFRVNTAAVWFTAMAFLELLDEGNKRGNVKQQSQIIATSSIAGFNRMATGGFAYGQSKAATTLLMKQLATALVPYGIRANVLCPGLYPSELAAPILAAAGNTWPKTSIPAERTGTEEDMAGAILYLTSLAGGYCNGNVLVTDGGRLSVMPGTY